MRIIIHNTDKIVQVNGVEARIWEGHSENGVPLHCYITRVAVDKKEDLSEFGRELIEQPAQCTVQGISSRMII